MSRGKNLAGWQWDLLGEIIEHLRDNPPAKGTSTRVKNKRDSVEKTRERRRNYLAEVNRQETITHE